MSIPVWVLLGFAGWTLLVLVATVGVYRWSSVFMRKSAINDFRAAPDHGSPWYRRSLRAHANCVENLPVYGAIVLAAEVAGAAGPTLDALAVILLVARVLQTLTHVSLPQTKSVVSVRFSFFFVQLVCMAIMGGIVARVALS